MKDNNELIIEFIYSWFKESVIYYPKADLKCKRLNTFAALSRFTDILHNTLGKTSKDTNTPYFHSRSWAKEAHNPSKLTFDYPLLATFETEANLSNVFTLGNRTKPLTDCITIELGVFDKLIEDCHKKGSNCTACGERNVAHIFKDTKNLLRYVLDFINNMCYITSNDIEDGWYNKQILLYLSDTEDITYTIDTIKTNKFKKMLKDNNSNINYTRYQQGDVYGTYINLKFCFTDCIEFIYNPVIKGFKVGPDTNCC